MDTAQANTNTHSLSAVRRELISVNERIDSINQKVNLIREGLTPVPERMMNVEDNLMTKAQKMAELEERNKLHSAKLKLLQKEVNYEKLRGELLMDYLKTKNESPRDLGYSGNVGYNTGYGDSGYPGNEPATIRNDADRGLQEPPGSPRRSQPASPRPLAAKDRSVGQKNATDPYQERSLEDDLRGRQYPISEAKGKQKNGFDSEEMQKQRRREIYSVFDSTAINPQFYEEAPKHKHYPWFDHEVEYTRATRNSDRF